MDRHLLLRDSLSRSCFSGVAGELSHASSHFENSTKDWHVSIRSFKETTLNSYLTLMLVSCRPRDALNPMRSRPKGAKPSTRGAVPSGRELSAVVLYTPRHSRAGVLEGLGQAPGRLAHDLDVPHNVGTNELVGVKSGACGRGRREHLVDGIEHVAEQQSIRSESGTASCIR